MLKKKLNRSYPTDNIVHIETQEVLDMAHKAPVNCLLLHLQVFKFPV